MKVIALVGVSGTGKTTLMNNLEKILGDRVEAVPEATRGEVFKYNHTPILDMKKVSQEQLKEYDIGRVEYQLQREVEIINKSQKEIIIFDKALPVSLMYLLTLSSRAVTDDVVDYFVSVTRSHVKRYYSNIIYFPTSSFCDASNKDVNRNFRNNFILDILDSSLQKVLSWIEVPKTTLYSNIKKSRVNLIMSEIGINFQSKGEEWQANAQTL